MNDEGQAVVEVLITDAFAGAIVERIRAVDPRLRVREATPALQRAMRDGWPKDPEAARALERDAAELLPPTEVVIGWGGFPVEALRWAERLRWIQTTGAGIDLFDRRVRERVTLTTGAGVGAEAIAEHVICLLLMLARGLPVYLRRQVERRWEREFPAREVAGLTMGIIGMGAIGSAVARRARGLGLRVIGLRRSVAQRRPDLVADEVCPPGDLPYLLGQSDVVVVATPLTQETRGLIGERELRTMRPGAYLINVSRGPVIDEPALVAALAGGHLGGAGLDVFTVEPLPPESPLWDMPNVIITPHVSAAGDRYIERLEELVCDNLRRYLHGQPLRNLVPPDRGY